MRSSGWVSHRHGIRKVQWEYIYIYIYVCVCVCVRARVRESLILIYSLETLSPVLHAFSVFAIIGVSGWNFFLPWNVKSYFRLCSVSLCLTWSVCKSNSAEV